MNYRILTASVVAVATLGTLAYRRYVHRDEAWTTLDKVSLVVGGTAMLVTVVVTTKDYQHAKAALKAAGQPATDQAIAKTIDPSKVEVLGDISSKAANTPHPVKPDNLKTLGDIAREYNLTPQKAGRIIQGMDIPHADEVIRTGADKGWHYCKVYGAKQAAVIRTAIEKTLLN